MKKKNVGTKKIRNGYIGVTIRKGYRCVLFPSHPFCTKLGYVREHRLIMEQHLGRFLKKKEVVHHKDENKMNNAIKNLLLFPNHSAHMKYEWKKRKRK